MYGSVPNRRRTIAMQHNVVLLPLAATSRLTTLWCWGHSTGPSPWNHLISPEQLVDLLKRPCCSVPQFNTLSQGEGVHMSQDGGQSMQGYDHQLSTAQPTDPIMMSDPGSPQLQDPQTYGHPAQHAHLQGFGEEPMGSADIGLIRGYHNPAGTLEDISHAAGRVNAL